MPLHKAQNFGFPGGMGGGGVQIGSINVSGAGGMTPEQIGQLVAAAVARALRSGGGRSLIRDANRGL